MMNFSCDVRQVEPSFLLVTLKGVLDVGTSVHMESSLSSYLKDENIKKIVLVVPELTFISSSGLRVMMLIIKSLVPRQGKLYMVGGLEQIVGLVKMSGMTKWIILKNSIEECVND